MIDLGMLSDITRAIIYPIGAFGCLNVALRMRKHRAIALLVAIYFLYWSIALFVRLIFGHAIYQSIVDLTATPLLAIMVCSIWLQVWRMRLD